MPGISGTSARRCAASNTSEKAWSVSPAASRQRAAPATSPRIWRIIAARRLSSCASSGRCVASSACSISASSGWYRQVSQPELQVGFHSPQHVCAVAAARQRASHSPASSTSATDVRAKNSDSSAGRGGAARRRADRRPSGSGEPGHRGHDVGAVPEPGGGQPQPGHPAFDVMPEPPGLTGVVRRCSPSAVNSSAVSGSVSARSRWRSSASQPRPRHRRSPAPTRQSGRAGTAARRGRMIARTGTAGHPDFERGTGSRPPAETARARHLYMTS
jgi:hypothetical protein